MSWPAQVRRAFEIGFRGVPEQEASIAAELRALRQEVQALRAEIAPAASNIILTGQEVTQALLELSMNTMHAGRRP